ncbi:hypothetical protein F5887DRAFT_987266 [Amanita rubescens]|nr:hypothetical protein F5887DRAFT_987266 [Amanita rubescens]
MNITFSFTGVSIWVFFMGDILSVPTSTECSFTIDGNHMGAFSYQPNDGEAVQDIQYNAIVFSGSGLSNSQHEFVISTSGAPNMTYVNFDYAIYTADVTDNVNSSTSTSLVSSSSDGIVGDNSRIYRGPSSMKFVFRGWLAKVDYYV